MNLKIKSLRINTIILLSVMCFLIFFSTLIVSEYIFKKNFSKTIKDYLYNICSSTSSAISLNVDDNDTKINTKIKYILQNVSIEDMKTLKVGLLDSNGKYIYYTDETVIGRYISDNEIIEKIVIHLRDGELFNDNVSDGLVEGKKQYIAYVKTYNNNLLFMQIEQDDVLKPIHSLTFYSSGFAIMILVLIIFVGSLLVNTIYKKSEAIQNELEAEKERAEKASNAKSDFLASMSHEIRTPINSVLGMNEMILRETSEMNIREYANNIKTSGYTLLSLINDILDFSKIASGKLSLNESEYETRSIFNDLIIMFDMKAKSKGIQFKVDIDSTFPEKLYGDEIRLKQVITNILSNAIKYTNDGFVAFSLKTLGTNDGVITFRVSVQDTGIGIKKEDLNKLFESFQRLDEKKNKNIEGTGLGMAITKQILDLMNSNLQVVSEYGKGSVFSFILQQKIIDQKPIGEFNDMQSVKNQGSDYTNRFIAPNAKVLLVDDVEMNLKVALSLMKNLKMSIDTALSGKEAIEKCKNTQYDLILMDYMMPEMDGIECTEKIRSDVYGYAFTPIIALTADAVVGAKTKFTNAGMQDYITKPINIDRLEQSLAKWLPKEKVELYKEIKKENSTIITYTSSDNQPEKAQVQRKLDESGIPQIDGINSIKAIQILGSTELFLESLKMYHDSIDKKAKMIKDCEASEDIENFTVQVHGLKSMSRSIGCTEIGDMAEELENLGLANNIEEIHAKTPEFLSKYREYKVKLVAYASIAEESLGDKLGINDMKIKLDELADYINACDIDKAEEWLNGINKIDFDNYEELNEIKTCIEDIKFNSCKDAINRLLEKIDNEE